MIENEINMSFNLGSRLTVFLVSVPGKGRILRHHLDAPLGLDISQFLVICTHRSHLDSDFVAVDPVADLDAAMEIDSVLLSLVG